MSTQPRRIRWRPKFSVVGIAGSILGAIGVLVILQQRGSVYPTTVVEIVTLVIGLVIGVGVPSLFRLIAVRRINRRVARRSHAAGS
jgi:membrane-bound ClpP family serine protease